MPKKKSSTSVTNSSIGFILLMLAGQLAKQAVAQPQDQTRQLVLKYATIPGDEKQMYPALVLNFIGDSPESYHEKLAQDVLEAIEDMPILEKYIAYTDWQFKIIPAEIFYNDLPDELKQTNQIYVGYEESANQVQLSSQYFDSPVDTQAGSIPKISMVIFEMLMREIGKRPRLILDTDDGEKIIGPQFDQNAIEQQINMIESSFHRLQKRLTSLNHKITNGLQLSVAEAKLQHHLRNKPSNTIELALQKLSKMAQFRQQFEPVMGKKWVAMQICSQLFLENNELNPLSSFPLVKKINAAFRELVNVYVDGLHQAKAQQYVPGADDPKISFNYPAVDPANIIVTSNTLWAEQEKATKHVQHNQYRYEQQQTTQESKPRNRYQPG